MRHAASTLPSELLDRIVDTMSAVTGVPKLRARARETGRSRARCTRRGRRAARAARSSTLASDVASDLLDARVGGVDVDCTLPARYRPCEQKSAR